MSKNDSFLPIDIILPIPLFVIPPTCITTPSHGSVLIFAASHLAIIGVCPYDKPFVIHTHSPTRSVVDSEFIALKLESLPTLVILPDESIK